MHTAKFYEQLQLSKKVEDRFVGIIY